MKLPYITESLEGIGGKIREREEDFLVEEVGLYECCGSGEHLFVNFTKKGITSRDLQVKVAESFGVKNSDIGVAGMKDKDAVTTQTFSIRTNLGDEEARKKVERLGVKVNWVKRHKNKLRVGHLIGNRFRIVISGTCEDAVERAERIKKEIEENGVPNYYGSQRFGFEGGNVKKGLMLIKGKEKVKDRWLKRFLISGYQSYLCNLYLSERMRKGLFNKILVGDVCKKYDTGGMFIVEDKEKEQKRHEAKEISFTAPIYGLKMRKAEGEAEKFEKEVILRSEVTLEELEKLKVMGTRRLGRVIVKEMEIEECRDGIVLKFFLPKGSYATTVLREFMKNDE